MGKRILTAICYVLVIASFFALKIFVNDYLFDVLILLMGSVAAFEGARIFAKAGLSNEIIASTAFPSLLFLSNFLCIYYKIDLWIALLIDIALILFATLVMFLINLILKQTKKEMEIKNLETSKAKYSFKKAMGNMVSFIYPSLFFMIMMFLNHFDSLNLKVQGFNGLLSIICLISVFLIPIFTDTFAMLTGMLIGGKKLCPKLSPKKTISGAVGGTLWCVLLCACVYLVLNATSTFNYAFKSGGLAIWMFLLIVLFGSIIAQFGDLFESFLKRRANIKDSGKILPGHGGMLDRIDSYIFVVPYLMLAFCLVLI